MPAHKAISCHKHATHSDRTDCSAFWLLVSQCSMLNAIKKLTCNLKDSTDELVLAVHASFTFMYAFKQSLAREYSRLTVCVCCSDMLGDCDRNDAHKRSDDPPSSG